MILWSPDFMAVDEADSLGWSQGEESQDRN